MVKVVKISKWPVVNKSKMTSGQSGPVAYDDKLLMETSHQRWPVVKMVKFRNDQGQAGQD